jgi:cephalosporin hydroxylase
MQDQSKIPRECLPEVTSIGNQLSCLFMKLDQTQRNRVLAAYQILFTGVIGSSTALAITPKTKPRIKAYPKV